MENTAINNQRDYLSLVKNYLLQIKEHVLRENRAKIVKGVSSVLTDEALQAEFRQAFAEFRAANSKESMSVADAGTEFDTLKEGDYFDRSTYKTAISVLLELGSTPAPEHFEVLKGFSKPKPTTSSEKIQDILDKCCLACAETALRRINVDGILKIGKPAYLHSYCQHKNLVPRGSSVMRSFGVTAEEAERDFKWDRVTFEKLESKENQQLIVPLTYAHEYPRWITYQTINPNSKIPKKFADGTRTHGLFHPIGDIADADTILVAEGMATGETLYQATGIPVACAMSKANVANVALMLDYFFDIRRVLICADIDANHDEDVALLRKANRRGFDWVAPDFSAVKAVAA